jgi:ubiquitin carboxyl-terminal hydrolase 8
LDEEDSDEEDSDEEDSETVLRFFNADGEELWEVEKIVGYRVYYGKPQYRIRWKRYSRADDTWEPWAHVSVLHYYHKLVEDFSRATLALTRGVKVSPGLGTTMHGLANHGNVCYMNSIFQCLSANVALSSFFLADLPAEPVGSGKKVVRRYAKMIKGMWHSKDDASDKADALKELLQARHSQFAGSHHQDAQEFFITLMSDLHSILKKPARPLAFQFDPLDIKGLAVMAWEKYQSQNDSIISNLFYGQMCTTRTCRTCEHETMTFETFDSLALPVPPRATSLRQCLDAFFATEIIPAWQCDACKMYGCRQRTTISRMPHNLVVILKRFAVQDGKVRKIEQCIDFPEHDLDLRQRPFSNMSAKTFSYSLYGVCSHVGTTGRGHYTAFVKQPFSERWFLCDDAEVTEVEEISPEDAYVLFYTARDFFVMDEN